MLPAAYGPQPFTIRAGGKPHGVDDGFSRAEPTPEAYDLGWKEAVSVCHVSLRSALSQFAAFAVYISP
jgi:hypothetical protein